MMLWNDPEGNVEPLALLPSQKAEIKAMIEKKVGMHLVLGTPGTCRTAALEAFVSCLREEDRIKVSVVAPPGSFKAPAECLTPVQARGDRMMAAMHFALDTDPDVIVIDPIDEEGAPALTQAAADAAGWGIGIWASMQGLDVDSALGRLAEICGEERDPIQSGKLAGLSRVISLPRICQFCSTGLKNESAVSSQARSIVNVLAPAAANIRARSGGCEHCQAGYLGSELICEAFCLRDGSLEDLKSHGWSKVYRDWLNAGGVSFLHHALIKVAEGLCDLSDVLQALGPIENINETAEGLSALIETDLAAIMKDNAP